jgi:4-amino-4-deoxy-L-arabinose transferase-like glycosyltransferase
VDKFTAYRIGPALFFAALVTVMYLWMTELFSKATGLFSALAVILTPNLFGFAHIAVTDLPLASMWFLTAYIFWKGLSNWKGSILLGVIWGLALSTKFPALLIPVPLILWAHLFHRERYVNNVFALFFLAPMIGR